MEESTKRIIANEIKFAFKWSCVGIVGFLFFLLLFFINEWLDFPIREKIIENCAKCSLYLPIYLYAFRGIIAIVKWVKKYAD